MSRRQVPELDTPFSAVEWPAIPQNDQDAILEILCALLAPLGQHRRDHTTPSQGQRSRRRAKREQKKKQQEAARADNTSPPSSAPDMGDAKLPVSTAGSALAVPPPPALAKFVDVGLTSVTRELAAAASLTPLPSTSSSSSSSSAFHSNAPPYAAIFLVRSGHPSAFYSHFPQMVAVASRGRTSSGGDPAPIHLVGFSRAACEDRLSTSLGVPRVSCIGLRTGAPQAQGLLGLLAEKVPPVTVPWLDEAQAGTFRPTKVVMKTVSVGPKKRKRM